MRIEKLFSVLLLVSVVFMLMFTTGCSKVPAGYVGVKVYLLGNSKGVDTEELSPGRYFIGWNRDLYKFPTFSQNYVWTQNKDEGSPNDESISFQTIEGLSVGADVGITYAIKADKASAIFEKYRKGVDEITDIYIRNMVRDAFVKAASTRPVESVYGAGKADLLTEVEDTVRSQVEEFINVERIYLINDLRLPHNVVEALNAKIQATQKAVQSENELRTAEAEAQKAIATSQGQAQSLLTIAKAQAEANQILARSLTSELVRYKSIEAWDGKLPTYTGGGSIPLINLN